MRFSFSRTAPVRRTLSLLAASAALLTASATAQTTYVVDSAADDAVTTSSTPDGTLTLREAIAAANTNAAFGDAPAGSASGDVITFDPDVERIELTLGELDITDDVSIDGGFTTALGPKLNKRSRIFVVNAGGVSISDITLQDGYTLTETGGAISIGSGQVTLEDVTFDRNRAVDGGAVYVAAGALLLLNGATFNDNRATGGGATNGGGAIYTAGEVNGGANFYRNRATVGLGSGGALYVAETGTAALRYAYIEGNRAARGGGAEVNGGLLDLEICAFVGNVAGPSPGNGGAIHITGAGSVVGYGNAAGTRFIGNVALADGGGVWNSATGSVHLTGVQFSDNVARGAGPDQGGGGIFSDGGPVYHYGGQYLRNSAVGAEGSGGAIFVSDAGAGPFTVEQTSFLYNSAARAGGAIEVNGGVLTLSGPNITGNTAGNNPGNGGGLHITGAGTVSANTGPGGGGGFYDNVARNAGGAVWNSGTGTLSMQGIKVSGNSVISGNGGGVYQAAGETGTTTISRSELSTNEASASGGALFAEGGTVSVVNSTLSGNAAVSGAGAAVEDAAVSFASSTIASNTASGRGGGVYNPNRGRRVLLQNTIVADNAAGTSAVELSGYFESAGHNIIESIRGAGIKRQLDIGDQFVDPMLDPLNNNNGNRWTHEPRPGSPAIDMGMTDLAGDQTGRPRTSPHDVGAHDFGPVSKMIISGLIDGPLSSGLPKAIEVYVVEDIADLGLYGLGVANARGGTDGVEFSFPDGVSATAGEVLYVSLDVPDFTAWFGFAPDYTSPWMDHDGDDPIELFVQGQVKDVFGIVNVDGTGRAWEYTDGWAYRNAGTGPDDNTFEIGNWSYSGPGALAGETSNAAAATPFPAGTYSPTPPSAQDAVAGKDGDAVAGLAPVAPNPIRSTGRVRFSVSQSEPVTVALYDMMGRRVQGLYTGTPAAQAVVEVTVDAGALASGVYVVVMQSETVRETRRVTVAR